MGDPEHGKQLIAYLRHISTLSAGAIVLQVGFLEKLFPHPHWKPLIAVSLSSFTISILASVVAQSIAVGKFSAYSEVWAGKDSAIGCVSLMLIWLGFVVGLLAPMTFAFKNLFSL